MIEADRLNQIDFKIFYLLAQEKKGDNYKFGPVVANSIKIWKTVERRIGGPFKFCNSTPLWHNLNFVCGNRPFVQPSWSSLGVNTCGVICMITRASVHFRHWEPNFVYQHLHILFSSITFCSQSVWRSLVCFHFLSSYAGLDCTICWSAICFLNI